MNKSNETKISKAQRGSYHEWLQATADECVGKGIDLTMLFENPVDIPVTKDTLHKGMTHKLIKFRYNKDSTEDCTETEINEVINDLRNIISKRSEGKVNLPFPLKSLEQHGE